MRPAKYIRTTILVPSGTTERWAGRLISPRPPLHTGGKGSQRGRIARWEGAGSVTDWLTLRRELVDELRNQGISDPRVLAALGRVERERFVPEGERSQAY